MAVVINEDFRVVLCDGSPGDDANGLDCFCGPQICGCGCCNFMIQIGHIHEVVYKHYFTPYEDGTGIPSHEGVFSYSFTGGVDGDVWNWRCKDGCEDEPCNMDCEFPPCSGDGFEPPPCPPGADCANGFGFFQGDGGWGRPIGGWGNGWPPDGNPAAVGIDHWLKLGGSFKCIEIDGMARYDFIFTIDLLCTPGANNTQVNPCGDQQGVDCFPEDCPTCPASGNCGQLKWHYQSSLVDLGTCPNGLFWSPAEDFCSIATQNITQGWCVEHPPDPFFEVVACVPA